MRRKLIGFLKRHPWMLRKCWKAAEIALRLCGLFVPIEQKKMLFSSFGGRSFDDSPKALYDEICRNPKFSDWELVWAFVEPEKYSPCRGRTVKIDTPEFFLTLLMSKVWVSNSGMTRGIKLKRRGVIRVETWHGTPLKKIGGEENSNTIGGPKKHKGKKDARTIRCAQSEFDCEIFQRIQHAEKSAYLICDLPRNDALLQFSVDDRKVIREALGIPQEKKVILYTPTYREYLLDENKDTYIAPPMDLLRWKKELGEEYVLLFRAHYAVTAALELEENEFVWDVSDYPRLNDLYSIADVMISDYSSTFFDYAILDRPMLCFAYDLEEYEEKRGLYLDLAETLPCPISRTEEELLALIKTMDWETFSERTREFHMRFAPHAGHASEAVVKEMEKRLGS